MPEEVQQTEATTETETTTEATGNESQQPTDGLGEGGKKAIDSMKAERNAARKELSDVQKKLKTFEDAQKSAEQRAEESAKDAEKRAHAALQRIAAAEARAALTGVVPDPAGFVEDLNLSRYITDSGDVDSEAISALAEKYSSFSQPPAQKGPSQNPAQGANAGKPQEKQLNREDLKKMSPEQVNDAYNKGLLNSLMGVN